MKTISSHVEAYLHEYPFLSKFLRQGVINYKALARRMEPEISKQVGQKVSVGAIAVSLQRIHHRDKDKIFNLIGRLRGVAVSTGLGAYASNNDSAASKLLQNLLASETGVEKPFILPLRAKDSTVIFVEKTLVEQIETYSDEFELVKRPGAYAALAVTRELLSETEIGGLSYPLQVLAEHGILVGAVSATFDEEIVVVDEADADKAAAILRHALWR